MTLFAVLKIMLGITVAMSAMIFVIGLLIAIEVIRSSKE